MSRSLSELTADFQAKHAAHKALIEKGPEMTQEDALQAQTLVTEMRGLQGTIQSIQQVSRHQAVSAELGQWANTNPNPVVIGADALPHGGNPGIPTPGQMMGFIPAGETAIELTKQGMEIINTGAGVMSKKQVDTIRNPEYHKAFWKQAKHGTGALTHTEIQALQEGIDSEGGYLVPEQLLNTIVQKKPTPTRLAGKVANFTTVRDTLAMPKVNYTTDDLYTTGMRVTWTGEIPASASTHRATQPVFGMIRIPVYTAMMSLLVTNDLMEDSMVMLQGYLSEKITETIELLKDNMILNGTGASQPSGILQNPNGTDEPATVVTGDASLLTADGIQSLGWSLPEQYDDSAEFVFNKTNTGQALAKLKDGDGRYVWGLGLQDSGLVPTIRGRELLGYPVTFSGFAPNVAANAYPIVFGDLKGYFAVTRIGVSVQFLRELYAETNQVLVLVRIRFGGDVAEPWRLKIQKVAAS